MIIIALYFRNFYLTPCGKVIKNPNSKFCIFLYFMLVADILVKLTSKRYINLKGCTHIAKIY